MAKDPSDDPKRIVLTLTISDDIVPRQETLTRNSYERLLAAVERTGMSIEEVLDDLIARRLPHPDGDDG